MKNLIYQTQQELKLFRKEKRFLIIPAVVLLSILWMVAKSDTPFWPLVQESIANSGEWDMSCPVHQGSAAQQEVICYAWQISNHDKTFIYLLKAENGLLTFNRRHNKSYWCARTKRMEDDFGFGISACYHPDITSDPQYFSDWRWNVEATYRLYKKGTRFYGLDNIHKVKKYFQF